MINLNYISRKIYYVDNIYAFSYFQELVEWFDFEIKFCFGESRRTSSFWILRPTDEISFSEYYSVTKEFPPNLFCSAYFFSTYLKNSHREYQFKNNRIIFYLNLLNKLYLTPWMNSVLKWYLLTYMNCICLQRLRVLIWHAYWDKIL